MNKDKLLRIIYPELCPVCKEPLTEKNRYEKNPYICKTCYKKAGFIDGPRCLKCAKPIGDETKPFCRECEEKKRYFDKGFALLEHGQPAKNIIYGLKFRYELDNIRFPALEISLRYGKEISGLDLQAFIPVPLHRSRLKERGYNQAQLIAQEISRYMKLIYGYAPCCDSEYLLRKEKTEYQRELEHRKREENVKNAFCVDPASKISYKRVCLVDDIYTTGSTINSCAETLKRSGCEKVYFVALSTVG